MVPEADGATQTDAFLDRPSTPLFVPPMTGTDAATQIENGALRRSCHGQLATAATSAVGSTTAAKPALLSVLISQFPTGTAVACLHRMCPLSELCCWHVLRRRAV